MLTKANLYAIKDHLKKAITLCPEFKQNLIRMIDFYENQEIDYTVKSESDFTRVEKDHVERAMRFCVFEDGGVDEEKFKEVADYAHYLYKRNNKFVYERGDIADLLELVEDDFIRCISDESKIFYVQNMRFNELSTLKSVTRDLVKTRFKEEVLSHPDYQKKVNRILELLNTIRNESEFKKFIETRI